MANMASLLVLALLVSAIQASPTRLEKRDTHDHQCPSEIRQLTQLFGMLNDFRWEDLENFSLRTPLGILGNNTSQNMINYFISEWFQYMEDSITTNAGAPYESYDHLLYHDKKFTKMANRMMLHEIAQMSRGVVDGLDKANMEAHKCMSNPHMMKEMGKGVKMQVFMVQGMAGAVVDWDACRRMLDCYEGFYDSNADHPVIKFLNNLNWDPKMCLRNAKRLLTSLQRMLESEDLHKGVSMMVENCVRAIESMDVDDLFSEVYKVFFHMRGHCIQTNWNSVATGAYKTCDSICKGMWRVMTGRWPEMVDYLQRFRVEVQKDSFWQRLDRLFQAGVSQTKEMYSQNQGTIGEMVAMHMRQCANMVDTVEKASYDIGLSFMELCKNIRMFGAHMLKDYLEMMPHQLESIIMMLPTSKMVCKAKMENSMVPPFLMAMAGGESMEMEYDHDDHDDHYEEDDDHDDYDYHYDEGEHEDHDQHDSHGVMPMENFLMTMEDNMPTMGDMEMIMMAVNETVGDLFFSEWPEGINFPAESMKKTLMDGLWKMNYALVSPYCKHMMYGHYDMAYMPYPEPEPWAQPEYEPYGEPEYEPEWDN